MVVGYGLSETAPAASIDPVDGKTFSDTIGLPLPSTEMSIQDDKGKILSAEKEGEICIRGPQVMRGYWSNKKPPGIFRIFNNTDFQKITLNFKIWMS